MFDYFEPNPPIRCFQCETGNYEGWQGYHSKQALLLWRQHDAAPVDQLVDEDCKVPEGTRAKWRLPQDEGIYIHYGKCSECDAHFPYKLDLRFTGDTWTGFAEGRAVRYGKALGDNWIQCPDCMDAFESLGGQPAVECPKCKLLVILETDDSRHCSAQQGEALNP